MASELISADGRNTLLWPSLQGAFLGRLDIQNGVNVKDILRKYEIGLIKEEIYQPLIDALKGAGFVEYNYQNNAYVADGRPERITSAKCDLNQNRATLFLFPYDFRQPNEKSAEYLKDYIDCVRKIYPDTPVDIVAHSMGGLLARRMILDTNTQANGNDHPYVRRLVTLGTPFWGAPQANHKIENGDFFSLPRLSALFGWANPANAGVLGTMRQFKSLHQLLPSKALFDNSPAARSPFGEGGPGWLGLGDIRYWDINGSGAQEPNYAYGGNAPPGYKRLMDVIRFPAFTPMTTNETFHSHANANRNKQDDWSGDTTGVTNYHIIGIGLPTPVKMEAFHLLGIKKIPIPIIGEVLKSIKPGNYFHYVYVDGDGTVPRLSAERTMATNNRNPNIRVLLGSKGKGLEHVALAQDKDSLDCVLHALGVGNKCPEGKPWFQDTKPLASRKIELHNAQSVAAFDALGNRIDTAYGSPAMPSYSVSDAELTIPPGQEVFIRFQTLSDPDASSLLQVTTTDDNNNDIRKTVYLDPQTRFDRPPEQVNGILGQLHIDAWGNATLQFDWNWDGAIDGQDYPVAPTTDTTDPNMVADGAGPEIVVSNFRIGPDGLRYVTLAASDPSGLLLDTVIGTPPFVVSLQNDGNVIDNLVNYTMGTEVQAVPGSQLTACAVDGAANRSCVIFNIP